MSVPRPGAPPADDEARPAGPDPTSAAPPRPRPDLRRLLPVTGDVTLQVVAQLAARALGTNGAEVTLVADEHVALATGGPQAGPPGRRREPEQAFCTLVTGTDAPVVIDDAHADPRVAEREPVVRGEVGAYLGVPLRTNQDGVVGALCVFERRPRVWTHDDLDLLLRLAAAAADRLTMAGLDHELGGAGRQEALAGAAHAAGIGSFSWDVTDDVLVWDEPLLSLFGYAPGTFPGHIAAFNSRLHPEDLAATGAAIEAALTQRGEYAAEFRVVRPDGTVRQVAARGRVLETAPGRPFLVGAVTDVTALRERDARTAEILEDMPVGFIALDRAWRITAMNKEAERVAEESRANLVGRDLWSCFPGTSGTVFEENYRRAVAEQRDAVFDAYYPAPLDVWLEIRASPGPDGLALYFLDVTARQRALQAEELSARRMRGVAQFALALGRTDTMDDLVRTIAEDGLRELGCNGGSIAMVDPDDETTLLSRLASSYGASAQRSYGRLPLSADLPVAKTARTGRRLLLPDRRSCLEYSAAMPAALEATGAQAFATLPLVIGGRTIGVVAAGWSEAQPFDAEQISLLETFAAQCAQALQRLDALQAERDSAARVAGLSLALQRSLLADLPDLDHLELAARYLPAADEAQVGGDWYDAFTVADGSTCVVVGDVTGHDQDAVVQMGQLRNILRGTAHAVVHPPAEILRRLDHAMHDLALGVLATTVLATIDPAPSKGTAGGRTVRWCNAGHPPPLLVLADGGAELLDRPGDLMLGVGVPTDRVDHTRDLPPGATLLLYTDGLVERREELLDTGLVRLRDAAGRLAHLPLEEFCDALLEQLAEDSVDDIALLAIRAHTADGPRPGREGPTAPPRDLRRRHPAF
ncbi:SpoIIE family protein phosphatase [Kineococcus gynurae]|uniref:SpoIIE family protein phosphatase n=1 Tax=Kineococcus gynurae TaxID=452979 RepID=A0ABV5LPJ5_9ACTN